jgi:hypothetical protein
LRRDGWLLTLEVRSVELNGRRVCDDREKKCSAKHSGG